MKLAPNYLRPIYYDLVSTEKNMTFERKERKKLNVCVCVRERKRQRKRERERER
jgi:hypothetical protein